MTLRHLSIFIAVCKYKSVTAAANKLFLAQPTVSLAIRELEEQYDVRLFDRISRKLYLTEPGKQFLNYATQIVSLSEQLKSGIREWDALGPIHIGASVTIGTCLLPQYVSLFRQSNPGVAVYVTIEDSEKIEKRVLDNEIDFGLIEGCIHSEHLISEQFMEDEMVLICGNRHELALSGPLDVEQIRDYDFVLREKGSGTRELFESALMIHNISITPIWESISTQAIVEAVAAGHGLSVLPHRLVKSALEQRHIRQLILKDVTFKRSLYILYHKNKFLTRSARNFIALCKAQTI